MPNPRRRGLPLMTLGWHQEAAHRRAHKSGVQTDKVLPVLVPLLHAAHAEDAHHLGRVVLPQGLDPCPYFQYLKWRWAIQGLPLRLEQILSKGFGTPSWNSIHLDPDQEWAGAARQERMKRTQKARMTSPSLSRLPDLRHRAQVHRGLHPRSPFIAERSILKKQGQQHFVAMHRNKKGKAEKRPP